MRPLDMVALGFILGVATVFVMVEMILKGVVQ